MRIPKPLHRAMKCKPASWLALLFSFQYLLILTSGAQQIPDTSYRFPIVWAAYAKGEGPVLFIDEAHHNFHTRGGGFSPFARLMEQDGYRVESLVKTIRDAGTLKGCKILVIVNALNEVNVDSWALPTPSAFTGEEVGMIKKWVEDGGNLLLVADHMPFAGAATELGQAFGFGFLNGFARTGEGTWPPSVFSRRDGTLPDSPVTRGIMANEKIDSVATFTGSAFTAPGQSVCVLGFLEEHVSLQPDTAWRFNSSTKVQHLKGFQQGALLNFGKGRVAVFGEAAMFTAQVVNGNFKVGINSESAPQNAQFALNLMHWLDGVTRYRRD